MLISAKFDSYCPCCGRPIFTGDLIEYLGYKKVKCVVCYSGIEAYNQCPHWSVESFAKRYTGSNKYPQGRGMSTRAEFKCLICGKVLSEFPNENKFIYCNDITYVQHGGAWGNNTFQSGIEHGAINAVGDYNSDEKSLYVLNKMLETDYLEDSIKEIITNHIVRINK